VVLPIFYYAGETYQNFLGSIPGAEFARPLGFAAAEEEDVPGWPEARRQRFISGVTMYGHPTASPSPMPTYGSFEEKWSSLRNGEGPLGPIYGFPQEWTDGSMLQRFNNYFLAGARSIDLLQIDLSHVECGWQRPDSAALPSGSTIGIPTHDTRASANGGRVTEWDRGVTASRGPTAYAIYGQILAKWQDLGAESGFLGYPVADQSEREGYHYGIFENGAIFERDGTAHEMHGDIYTHWKNLRATGGVDVRYPTTDELAAGQARYNEFSLPAVIYWHGRGTASEVHGAILNKWRSLPGGLNGSALGFPTTDETADRRGGRYNEFERGAIYWNPAPAIQAHETHGHIWEAWRTPTVNREVGPWGYPIGDVDVSVDGTLSQRFERAQVSWSNSIGLRVALTPPPPGISGIFTFILNAQTAVPVDLAYVYIAPPGSTFLPHAMSWGVTGWIASIASATRGAWSYRYQISGLNDDGERVTAQSPIYIYDWEVLSPAAYESYDGESDAWTQTVRLNS
jgi:uncharacterized protein with LGFP repeats